MNEQIFDRIGNTPLIHLKTFSKQTGCNIYGKAEFVNPGGSVKDRTAAQIIKDAIKKKKIKPGGTIVEGTAGNTGIGIALVSNAISLKSIIVVPNNQSQEKINTLKACGAEVVLVPPVSGKDPNHFTKIASRISDEMNKKEPLSAFLARQFDNLSNRDAHYMSSGPEIFNQLNGNVDAFICAIGTGGTLAGISKYLKEKNPNFITGLADPPGAALYSFYKNGVLSSEGSSITEGIGQGRITKNIEELKVDYPYQISDQESLNVMFDLVKNEGLFLGMSSGINVAGALRLASDIGPGKNIVTILCDSGSKYLSKIYNPDFLESKNLTYPKWLKEKNSFNQNQYFI
jgi:cysteine synthase A